MWVCFCLFHPSVLEGTRRAHVLPRCFCERGEQCRGYLQTLAGTDGFESLYKPHLCGSREREDHGEFAKFP